MMNKHIRMMIDEIFADMKMTADNLALRDELLANALARYEDAIAGGKTDDEAFIEVAASLGDVQELLDEMNAAKRENREERKEEREEKQEEIEDEQKQTSAASQPDAEQTGPIPGTTDLGDALNKAFAALEGFSQSIMPEAKKLVRQMDEATGGMIKGIGKAAKKGLRDAQKVAEEAIDKLSGEKGELVFDFGPKESEQNASETEGTENEEPEINLESESETETPETETPETEAPVQPLTDENGEVDEAAFEAAVDEMAREAEEAVRQAAETARQAEQDAADYVVRDADQPVSGRKTFPAAGLRSVEIQLDADDVHIELAQGDEIETVWAAQNVDGEPVVMMTGHTLSICRKNPDVFKTFFSVFKKDGGLITVRIPRGYAADYKISTTSGDVYISGIDAGDVKITTTSGSVRVEPDAQIRAGDIGVTTVSGHATVSACADDIAVTTVSGNQFISCDAHKVDVNVVSGNVHVEGACDEWEVEAVSSDVELLCTVAPTKKVRISSVHSTVRLALPSEIRGFVVEKGSAINCEIVNEFGPNRYGTCALPIRMETVSGKLMITRL